MDKVERVIKEQGPMLSGDLAIILEKQYNMSNDAARKAISRAKSPVQKLKFFPFNKNQVFCYIESQYKSPSYKNKLYESLKNKSVAVSLILRALENSNYIMNKEMLPIYSKSPVENIKGHRGFQRIISDLCKEGIVFEVEDEYYAISSEYCSDSRYDLSYSKSVEQITKIVVNDFLEWARKLNIIAYNSIKVIPQKAIFAHFQWGATAPSYITPLYDYKKNKPGFVVVDAVYKQICEVEDVRFFIEKLNVIRNFKGLANITPILLTNYMTNDALNYLKDNKVIIGILSNVFDKKYSDTLMNLFEVLHKATRIIITTPQKIESLIDEIAKNEGRFNNVMGTLFECMVGLFFHRLGTNYLEVNKLVPNNKGGMYEMDILADRDGKIIVVECKAYKYPIDKEYIEKWISVRIPVVRHFLNEIYPTKELEFSIWSLGGFNDQALELLNHHKNSTKKYQLNFLDKEGVHSFAKEKKDHLFCKQLMEHFREYGKINS